ncbi:MAG TPA: BACON domain-containing protein, partial [Bacteroidaceae bacterium]|nr:BACON domain-containing protein [Bacteroidaceae bacterium]
GGNTAITVTTNQTSWSACADKSWCKVTDKTSGQFTIVVDPNGTAVVRDATVTVNAGKATPVKITLSQQGAAPTLSLSPTAGTIIFSAAAKEAPIAPLHPSVIASILVKNPRRMINAYVLKMEPHD